MFTTFKEIESYVLSQNMKKRIALANAHDEPALSAVVNAKRRGVVEGTLIGKRPRSSRCSTTWAKAKLTMRSSTLMVRSWNPLRLPLSW